jgi:exonuclease III
VKRRGTWWCLRIGTWNVLSLYRTGASNILKQEMEKVQMDLVALQEKRWLGNGTLEKKNCVIFYSCNSVKHVFGVGFYVNSRFPSNILHFEPVKDRLCWIRVRGKFRNSSIINAHAPTEDKDDEEKDEFYLELETVYSQCPRHDIKMVLGDVNAKVGKEKRNCPYAGRN